MKGLLIALFVTVGSHAQAAVDLVCSNASITIEIYSVSDSDGNVALFLKDVEPVPSENEWISYNPEIESHWFSAVFSAPEAQLVDGVEGPSQLFLLEGNQAMLARDNQVHYLNCFER